MKDKIHIQNRSLLKWDFINLYIKAQNIIWEYIHDGFYVNKTTNDNNTCLVYSSFFILSNEKNEGGIILEENIPRKILFTQKYNQLNFTYPHSDINKNIDLKFNLLNEGIYLINIFAKDVKIIKEEKINSNTVISLKS